MLHTAQVEAVTNAKYPHYFEVKNKQNGAKFCLAAPSREEMVRWISAMTNASALPAPPGMTASAEAKLLEETSIMEARPSARPALLAKRFSSEVSLRTAESAASIGAGSAAGDSAAELTPPPVSVTESTSDKLAALYLYYQSQREFIRALTNIAEELRFMSPDERQAALQPKLDKLVPLPPSTYFPLSHSSDLCKVCTRARVHALTPNPVLPPSSTSTRPTLPSSTTNPLLRSSTTATLLLCALPPPQALLRITPNESIVFNTKARCPLMLICEVRTEAYQLADLATHIGGNDAAAAAGKPTPTVEVVEVAGAAPAPAAATSDVKLVVPGETMTLAAKKREAWADKEKRLKGESPLAGSVPSWQLASFIVKSNDDLRQEVFIMQMLRYFDSIWPSELTWLNCYHIEATGPDTGLIETIVASSDLDRLKKADGYTSLRDLFITRHGAAGSEAFLKAQDNFCRSLAGYSVAMWLLMLRDRHNGNLMLDEEGHYFHIDFGFCLGHSTGKGIGGLVECSAFKLTREYAYLLSAGLLPPPLSTFSPRHLLSRPPLLSTSCLALLSSPRLRYIDLLDGVDSPVYQKFCNGCVAAMQAAHAHRETIVAMIEIVGTRSKFPCFQNSPVTSVVPMLKQRLFYSCKSAAEVEDAFRKLIKTRAQAHWGSRRYDWFQNCQQGIAP